MARLGARIRGMVMMAEQTALEQVQKQGMAIEPDGVLLGRQQAETEALHKSEQTKENNLCIRREVNRYRGKVR